ncbi:hypothetical protein K8I28_01460 [bacterium]|nr:hypothetical protein [bacterium]
MKYGIVFILLTSLAFISPAHSEVDIFGYYENTFQTDYSSETEENLFDASKLRLDFNSGGGEYELLFQGNVNFIHRHGALSRDVRPYLPENIVREIDSLGLPVEYSFPTQRIYLDNAFLTWRKGKFRVRAGKQQLSWGPAYSFNPTDLFHKKDMLDPTYEKEGVTAFRADYYWGIGGQATAIIAPGEDLQSSGYALRLTTHLNCIGYDLAITLHSVPDSTSLQKIDSEDGGTEYLPCSQLRHATGIEFSGELLGMGFWSEGNYNFMESEEDFVRAVSGLDYTLINGTYLMFELIYNGRAELEAPYPLENWLANLYFGEPVGALYGMAGIRHDLTDLLSGSIYGFGGLDGGFVLNPRLDYSLAQNADLSVFGGFTFGDSESQFSPGLYSIILRANVYF